MCGIYGSNSIATLTDLNKVNLDRGASSRGYCVIFENMTYNIQKTTDNVTGNFVQINSPFASYSNDLPVYHLAHLQAPTGNYTPSNNTTHPFSNDHAIVAHNGIITNFESLKCEDRQRECNEVDSSIIPVLLARYGLKKTCEKLQGTFAFWYFDKKERKLYLVKHDCSLFYNDKGDFSSKSTDKVNREVTNNSIMQYNFNTNQWEHVCKFTNASKYFI